MFYRELRAAVPARVDAPVYAHNFVRSSFRGRRWNSTMRENASVRISAWRGTLTSKRYSITPRSLATGDIGEAGISRSGTGPPLSLTQRNRNCRGIDTRLLVWLSVWCVGRTYACGRTRLFLRVHARAPAIFLERYRITLRNRAAGDGGSLYSTATRKTHELQCRIYIVGTRKARRTVIRIVMRLGRRSTATISTFHFAG